MTSVPLLTARVRLALATAPLLLVPIWSVPASGAGGFQPPSAKTPPSDEGGEELPIPTITISKPARLPEADAAQTKLEKAAADTMGEQPGLFARFRQWVSGFVDDLFNRKDVTPAQKAAIVQTQVEYNDSVAKEAMIAKTNAAGPVNAGKGAGAACPADAPIKNFVNPENGSAVWNDERKTFFVGATRFGGPKDLQSFGQPSGDPVTGPNVSAYDHHEYIPAGLDPNRCEFGLPGNVPDGVSILIRTVDEKGNYTSNKTVLAERTDIGPMVTNDLYWGAVKAHVASADLRTVVRKAKSPPAPPPKNPTTSEIRQDPDKDPLLRGNARPPTSAKFPMRALDLTPGCWKKLGVPESSWSYVKWQFVKSPSKKNIGTHPQPAWYKSGKKSYFDRDASIASFPNKKWEWMDYSDPSRPRAAAPTSTQPARTTASTNTKPAQSSGAQAKSTKPKAVSPSLPANDVRKRFLDTR